MSVALPRPAIPALAIAPAWRRPLVALAGCWTVLLLLFAGDAADMAGIWWNDSTYGHCLFVPPIIGWLVWQRRRQLAELAPLPWWPGLAAFAAAALLWLLGWAGGLAIARHAALVAMFAATIPTLLGLHVARGSMFPIAYAVFLIPAGDELVQPLQTLTANMTTGLLSLFGVPHSIDGVLIRIPGAWFEVAEACAGANFVIAMAAYATLAAHVGFRSWRKRALFWTLAVAAPILANGVRAFATIWIAWLTDVNVAAGIDHVIYGWFFFAFVVAVVVAGSWRFFDRPIDDPAFDPARLTADAARAMPLGVAAALTLLIAAATVGWSASAGARSADLPGDFALPSVSGWQPVAGGGEDWAPHYDGADLRAIQRYRNAAGQEVELAVAAFARQGEGRELIAFGQGAIPPGWIWTSTTTAPANGRAERLTGARGVVREALTFYRVGTMTTGSERMAKLETLEARLTGGAPGAAAITFSARIDRGGRAAIDAFLRALGPVEPIADRARGA